MPKPPSKPIRNALGSRVRAIRESRGLSQADLAAKLQLKGWDIERTVLTKIELHRRCLTDYELILIVQVLGVTFDEFVGPKAHDVKAFFPDPT